MPELLLPSLTEIEDYEKIAFPTPTVRHFWRMAPECLVYIGYIFVNWLSYVERIGY